MNLLNYVDRYVFAAVGEGIKRDLQISSAAYGTLVSAFIIVYTIVSPAIGWLGDRSDRRKLLAFGVGLWSIATVATAFARSFNEMAIARAILGVGEASYGVVAPTLLADFFDAKRRGRIMGVFYLALPVGTAIGYGVGGLMEGLATTHAGLITDWAQSIGLGGIAPNLINWRAAFWVVGLPGIVIALLGLWIREPGRGASDAVPSRREHTPARPTFTDYLQILRTPSYLLNTAGMAAITFTTGALGAWIPSYFETVHGTRPEQKIILGLALAVAGLIGVLLGMWLPDKLLSRTKRAYMLWAAVAVLVAVPIGSYGLVAPGMPLALAFLTVASILMSSCLGPCNTITANVVPGSQRAIGFALSIFLLHIFGDIPSPPLVGAVADWLGTAAGMQSPLGRFFASVGAHPVTYHGQTTNITAGMLLIAPVLLIGSLCLWWGSKYLVRDQERALAAGGPGAAASTLAAH
jgi:predicted MFS family arabinose efflux permease